MSTKLHKVENNIAEFEVTIPAADFGVAVNKAYKKNVGYFNIPGFRKGKAPKAIIEKMYGVEVFYEDAINILLPDAYDAAVNELNLDVVDQPDVDVKEIGIDKDSVVVFKVAVRPQPEIKDYKGIEAEKNEHNVSDSDVDNEIKRLQERNARTITVEDRAAQNGDTVNIDFEGFVDGTAFPGGKGENFNLELGSGQFIPGFEAQVEGMKIDEEKTISVKFPEEYQAEELAGKDAEFKVKLHSITAKELPEIDDDFAQDVSEFDTLDELKKDIKNKLEESAAKQERAEIENTVIDKLVEANEFDIPEGMINTQLQNIAKDYDMRLSQQGISLQKYLEITGMTIDAFNEQQKPLAEKQVKANIILSMIAKQENIEVTEEDLDAEYAKMAEMYKVEAEQIKNAFPADMLKGDLLTQKAIDFVVDNAKITAAKKTAKKAAKSKDDAEKKPAAKKTTKSSSAKKDSESK